MNSIQQQMPNLDKKSQLQHNPIAIVGMASVFPQAKNLQQYWDNILQEVDCITDVPPERWNVADYYDPDPNVPDKTYCKRGGFIPSIDFNPLEFGLRPNILELTDVSQLLSLVVAREALKDAGYSNMNPQQRLKTGVILGVGGGQKLMAPLIARLQYPIWERVLRSSGIPEDDIQTITEKIQKAYIPWEENSFPGLLGNVIAGRIANRFDLGGLNCVVDAACAASLAAVRMAVSELASGRTDMMITGGVDTDNSIFMYMCFSKTPAFSQEQISRPFDANSDGMIVGEGVGMLVMKRLADAERDGDRIYAVMRGIGASSDGRYRSIYAPRPDGQALALKRAYTDAGVPLNTVGLIEAHGTGTVAGDLCEFTTLAKVFNEAGASTQQIALGSVKSQIGHTKAAAGSASLIKAALALHHKILPATINITEPNPKYDFEESPFYLNTNSRPWIRHANQPPRRAGISSFGFGGTNYHVVLEEYQADHTSAYRLHEAPQSILLSATTPAQLLQHCETTLQQLQGEDSHTQFLNLVASCKSLIVPQNEARIGFVAISAAEARTHLKIAIKLLRDKPSATEWTHPKGVHYRQQGLATKGKVVALFAGQGSQYVNMGKELALNFPVMRQVYGELDKKFTNGLTPISKIVFPPPVHTTAAKEAQSQTLKNTEYAQPGIGAMSVGLYKILQQAGFQADFTAGHSFGELTALWAAEVLTDGDYLSLVKARGEAMSSKNAPFNADAGTMLAVTADVETIRRELQAFPEITLANLNSREQVVLAGVKPKIAEIQQYLQQKGYSTVLLPVSAAFHTPLVGHAQRPFAKAIQATKFQSPKRIKVYSNATGQQYPTSPPAIQQTLADHILKPVVFKDQIENVYAAGGHFFVEFGPRNILTNLVKNILGDRPHMAVAVNPSRQKDSDRQLREAVIQLRVAGLPMTSIDPYYLIPESAESAKNPKLNVPIAGYSYVSDKTQTAYQDALTDGWQISLAQQQPAPAKTVEQPIPVVPPTNGHSTNGHSTNGSHSHSKPNNGHVPSLEPQLPLIEPTKTIVASSSASPVIEATPIVAEQIPETVVATPITKTKPIESSGSNGHHTLNLRQTLEQFHSHQTETAETHAQYLQYQAEYARTFMELSQQLDTVLHDRPNNPKAKAALETLGQSVKQFQTYQMETVNAHEQYLQHQGHYAEAFLNLVQKQYGKVSARVIEPTNGHTTTPMNEFLAEPLESQHSPFKSLPTNEIKAELPTPITPLTLPTPPMPEPEPTPVVETPSQPITESPEPTPQRNQEIQRIMLEVVSEKTGYPADMLSLDMDMEADLGIDSINRVEILAGVQERVPDLPKINPEALAELRTLQEIVDFIGGGQSDSPVVEESGSPVVEEADIPVVSQPMQSVVAEAAVPVSQPGLDVQQIMLEVVSEKTGYPADMLSLDMDMEADLGIDSINRVEILAGVQERVPDLPKINPEALAELRTLQEIVDFIDGGQSASPVAEESGSPVVEQVGVPVISQPVQPVIAEAAIPANQPGLDVQQIMLEVVSEKTGYPADMLSLDMDMEADLGIDSINRVEILAGVQERVPDLPKINPEALAELRTLQEIVDFIGGGQSASPVAEESGSPVVEQVGVPVISQPVVAEAVMPASQPGLDVQQIMLEVVSEKTGYPADMLSLDMDMEADLGIDSINRVEILAGVQERVPDLPKINPEALAELRTLQEIVDFIGGGQSASPVAEESGSPVVEQVGVPVVSQPVQPVIAEAAIPANQPGLDVQQIMLEVVSEKTGYPADMLSLDMDMEADLGIDSINRVEILAGVQERVPDLPKINPEALAELRTLQEIVDFIGGGQSDSPVVEESSSPVVTELGSQVVEETDNQSGLDVQQIMLEVVSEKTGYPADMLSLDMDMEADLGIDSINRVEILAGVQERVPDLPKINPEALAELRTLQEIVDFIGGGQSDSPVVEPSSGQIVADIVSQPSPNGAIPTPMIDEEPLPEHDIQRLAVRLKPLPLPDYTDFNLPTGHVCLLTDDGSAATVQLAQQLQQRNIPVVVLSFPGYIVPSQTQWPHTINRVVLPDMSESQLQQQLTAIAQQYGLVGALIHVGPTREASQSRGIYVVEAEKVLVKHLFLMAKHLQGSLVASETNAFMMVSRLDGALGLTLNGHFSAVDGSLFGLTKTLNQEWPAVYCRAVDLSPNLTAEQLVNCVLAELYDPNRLLVEVGYGDQGRVTQTIG